MPRPYLRAIVKTQNRQKSQVLKEFQPSIAYKDNRDKTGFHNLHVDVFSKSLAVLRAEIYQFLIMQLT